MIHPSLLLLAALAPLALADAPEMEAGWGPGGGGGHGPPRGPGGPPPWAPGRPGGPWATAAPNQAPQDPGCTARPACDSASAAAQSCSNRAAATGAAQYNDCLCQAGPSAAIRDCYAGCFGAGGPMWLAQCVPATTPRPAPSGTSGPGGGGAAPTASRTGTGPIPTASPSRTGTGPAPTGGPSGTRTGGPGPSGNGTVPSRTSGAGGSGGGPSLPPTATPVRSGAEGDKIVGSVVGLALGFLLAAQVALL